MQTRSKRKNAAMAANSIKKVPDPASKKTKVIATSSSKGDQNKKTKTTAAASSKGDQNKKTKVTATTSSSSPAPVTDSKPKKKKRKKSQDPGYSKNANKRRAPINDSGKNHMIAMRGDTRKKFIDKHGNEQKITTGMLVEKGSLGITSDEEDEIAQLYEEALISNPNFSPIREIIEVSMAGSPLVVKTKTTTMYAVSTMGKVRFLSNDPALKPVNQIQIQTDIDLNNPFFNSSQYQAIKKIHDTYKLQDITIDEKLLQKTARENAKNTKGRSQNKELVEAGVNPKEGSATQYAQETKLFDGALKWEWLHMIAHMILGSHSQTVDNLCAGTNHSNTEMLIAEGEIHKLAKKYPEGFRLVVKAHLIPETHLASQFDYQIITKGFTIPLTFNSQTPNKPHSSYKDYYHTFVKKLIKVNKKHVSQANQNVTPNVTQNTTPNTIQTQNTTPKTIQNTTPNTTPTQMTTKTQVAHSPAKKTTKTRLLPKRLFWERGTDDVTTQTSNSSNLNSPQKKSNTP